MTISLLNSFNLRHLHYRPLCAFYICFVTSSLRTTNLRSRSQEQLAIAGEKRKRHENEASKRAKHTTDESVPLGN